MSSATFQPQWWTDEHTSQWDHLKDALKRDWEQTKKDLNLGGKELNQGVTDTLDQAGGAEPIPPASIPNWDDAAPQLRYGVGARAQYGDQHRQWNDKLETTLKNDWEIGAGAADKKWNDVRSIVRHGYDRSRS